MVQPKPSTSIATRWMRSRSPACLAVTPPFGEKEDDGTWSDSVS